MTFFAFALVFAVWGGLLLLRLLRLGLLLPGSIGEALRNRRNRRARESLVRGLIKLAEGKWNAAELEIVRQAPQHDAAVVNYLYAARVAQRRGDLEKRDHYLRQAYGAQPHAEIAVLLTQAELQMEQGQQTQALASLMRVQQLEAEQPRARAMLVELYAQLRDWAALYPLLLEIEKAELVSDVRWLELAVQAQRALLTAAAGRGLEGLRKAWGDLPKRLRRSPALIHTQAGLLAGAGAQGEAIALLKHALDHGWNPELGLLFSTLQDQDPVSQLSAVEAWLKQYGDDPVLLLVAGRLCRQNKLWGRARSCLESSFRLLPRTDTLLELGRVHEATSNAAAAQAAYR
ncbi:MAG: heme biosynthesis protein HemY, partial [Nevskiales bacterium]